MKSSVVLRPYQERVINEVRESFIAGVDRVLLQMPTGAGKTLVAGYILGSAARLGNGSFFIVNRIELLEQTARSFDRLGVRYGMIAPGFTPDPSALIQITMIETLKRRLGKIRFKPKLIVWDECRSLGSKGWTQVYEAFPEAAHLGLDATPVRLDGKGLGDYFDHLVVGPTYSELMGFGSLVPFDVYAPSLPDLKGVHTRGGDYDHHEIEDLMDKPSITGDIAAHYLKLAPGKLGITFAVSRKHSENLAAAYRAVGVRAMHVDGETEKGERKRILEAFRRRELDVLTNVDLFVAGLDVPGVEVITMVRPTQSLAVYMQAAGRGSRPEVGKDRCILLDHAGNVFRHGLPDMDREWTLEGRKKGERKKKDEDEVQVRQCEECLGVFWPPPTCPHCGHTNAPTQRELEIREGELRKIEREQAKVIAAAKKAEAAAAREAERREREQRREAEKAEAKRRRQEVGMARSLEELQAIAKARGYSPNWAENVWQAKEQRSEAKFEAQARAYSRM